MADDSALIVFSHLRWNFVFQRPQQILSRICRTRRVLFIEEPLFSEDASVPAWHRTEPCPGVTVLTPVTAIRTPGFCTEQYAKLRSLLSRVPAMELLERYDVWFYTPMALPLIDELHPELVIYDCMDELSGFLNAPPELRDNERALMSRADLVFTGGRSLYEAKRNQHPEVYCFPSSVDVAHFSLGVVSQAEAADQAGLSKPRLGYFGVLDERIDWTLVDATARMRPDWTFVFVGPVVKVDPAWLPLHKNIHYLGGKAYQDLPSYVRGWEVCLMPFALNEATRYISPTKVLEYMAAGKPIVSTPIEDVVNPYAGIVRIARSANEFVAACDQALQGLEAQERRNKASAVLAEASWDRTVTAMQVLMKEKRRAVKRHSTPTPTDVPVLVAGAGPTGLSAAYHLGEISLLVEKESCAGGWCRSIVEGGFTFDCAGHIMFSADPYVHEMYRMLLGDNVHWQDREAWIYSKSVYTRYPFQGSLYGLPPDVIQECIMGAIEARFGPVKPASKTNGTNVPLNGKNGSNGSGHSNGIAALKDKDVCLTDCCADGILESSASSFGRDTGEPKNFEEFIYKVWGKGIARHFAIPYNRKLWAVPLNEMETSWLGGRVPIPDLEEMIAGALKPSPPPMGPNARFGYPLRGGFQALMDGFLPHLKGRLRLNTSIVSISPEGHQCTLSDGQTIRYETFLSTIPLPALIRAMGNHAPASIRQAAQTLRHVSVRCVNIGVGRENLTKKHWIYYPEDTVFHRIFVQGNASPHCNAPGGFGLTCEITYSPNKPLPCDGAALTELAIRDCIRVGIIKPEDPIWVASQIDMPYAYVVYDHQRRAAVEQIREWLKGVDIHLAGRYSEWEYYNSDHAFIAGKKAASEIGAQLGKAMGPVIGRNEISAGRKL